jgi:hypothetical protein
MMAARFIQWIVVASIGFLFIGCSPSSPIELTIRGKIYFQDRPLNGGMIILIPEKVSGNPGELVIGSIQSDGAYQLLSTIREPIAPGLYRITVASLPGTSTGAKGLFREVPDRYRDPNRSELSVEIQAGNNRVDLFLDNY